MGYETHAEGTLVADGTEQTVTEISQATKLSGYISLSQMQAGDTVIIRQYTKLFASYEKYHEENYNNAQSSPIVYITPKEITSSLKVTLQQTVGALRSFEYKFLKEVPTVEIKVGGAYFKV